ncbi:nucleotidyltransferase family protein [Microbacterium sp. KR10-403]|uniref:nucleotidyltransferase family protein n=1 Tax=Microbacterium sp. KR10-403 TaxID=3158581 RepID=UPI0032E4F900
MSVVEVRPVNEARAGLTGILRGFRADPDNAEVVVFGSHRSPEAVLIPYRRYVRQRDAADPVSLREELHVRRELIARLARLSHIEAVSVFGSVARGEDSAESDIDLLVDPEPGASLFDFAQFERDMEMLLGRPVDVVSRRSLHADRDAAILREARPL